jgi:phage terminase large subunit-like protein
MASRASKPRPWWGDGLAPHLEWPGVTIEIPCRYVADRRRWESPEGRYYFDRDAAERPVDAGPTFFTHHIGAFHGRPFEELRNQSQLLTRPLFGWKRASDGLRRFRKVVYFAPKGSGKSPWLSKTGIYFMFFDVDPDGRPEYSAEVYALASDREQARIVHSDAKTMIEGAPELAARCEVLKDSIYVPSTRSTFKVLSADATTAHGWRPSACLMDEVQLQKNRDLLEVAVRSMSKRRQPVLIVAGHAGTDEESIGFEEYRYAKGVINGTLTDETLLPVIFEASETEDWADEDVWRRVNPGLGVTVQLEGLRQEAQEAKNEPRRLNDFKRYHLNIWTNQATAWLPIEWWNACELPALSIPALAAYESTGGLDMAQSIDYASFVVPVRVPLPAGEPVPTAEVVDETGTTTERPLDYSIAVFAYFWLPEDMMREREQVDGLPLSLYRDRGLLFTSPGATISADQVYRDITTKIAPHFPRLRTIGYDPAFAPDVAQRLSASFTVLEIPQTWNYMTAPCYTLEGLLKARRVSHTGHPILKWNVSNVEVKRDEAGRLRPVKPRVTGSHRKRIDGVVALLTALSVMGRQPAPVAEPRYQMMVLGSPRG